MKTRAKSFFKPIFMALLVSTLFVSCGKDNKSGGGSSAPGPVDPWSGNVNAAGNGSRLPANWLNVLINEHPCNYQTTGTNNNARTVINVGGSFGGLNVNANNLHVGVTLEGDILVISNNNATVQMQVHACRRPGMNTANAQFATRPVINRSYSCAMGEVSAANVYLQSNTGYPFNLAFFPAGMAQPSTLCQGGNNQFPF